MPESEILGEIEKGACRHGQGALRILICSAVVGWIVLGAATAIVTGLRFSTLLRLTSRFCLTSILGLPPRFSFATRLGLLLNVVGLRLPAEGHESRVRLWVIPFAPEVSGLLSVVGAAAVRTSDVTAGRKSGKGECQRENERCANHRAPRSEWWDDLSAQPPSTNGTRCGP